MPYKRKGKVVYKKTNGWKKQGASKTAKKAEAYRRLLEGIRHGWKPSGKRAKTITLKRRK